MDKLKRTILILGFICVNISVFSQYKYKTGHTELVRFNGATKLAGWNVAPGVTWMGCRFRNTSDAIMTQGDTSYNVTFNPSGRFGLYLEAGRHKIFEYGKIFHYMDYGIAYKGLRGKEEFEGEYRVRGQENPYATTSGNGKFGEHFILGHFNIYNVFQISDRNFIQNGIGANLDYAVIQNKEKNGDLVFQNDQYLPRLIGQLHYRLGFGIKMSDNFFIIPTIETPILNIRPWTNGHPSVNYFMSKYQPLILSIRFAWLGKQGLSCPPVYAPDGDSDKQSEFMKQQ